MSEFGRIWNCQALSNEEEGGPPTRLIIHEGGHKVDFTLASLDALRHLVTQAPLSDMYNRGYRVLLDKDHATDTMPRPTFRARPPPSEAEFLRLVNDFWHEAYHVPKYLVRDDLWLVKFRDWNLKVLLLEMLAWLMKSKRGWDHDTLYHGKPIKEWLDPEIYRELFECFAHFDSGDSWAAFFATARLLRRDSEETARRLGYLHSYEGADEILRLAQELHDRSTHPKGV
jgi:aminoglycoside 6-adenylyltransferase